LDRLVRVCAQELDVADLDGMFAADGSHDTRHDVDAAAATWTVARVVEIDAVEGSREAVAVAFAADLAVGNDVDAGPLHVADGDPGGVILGLFEEWLRNAPQVSGAYPRWESRQQLVAIDKPVGLG